MVHFKVVGRSRRRHAHGLVTQASCQRRRRLTAMDRYPQQILKVARGAGTHSVRDREPGLASWAGQWQGGSVLTSSCRRAPAERRRLAVHDTAGEPRPLEQNA
jgi:hypothetical protein